MAFSFIRSRHYRRLFREKLGLMFLKKYYS